MRTSLILCGLSLLMAGCVAVPVRERGYGPAYYAAPVVVAPAPYPWYHRRW